MAGPFPGMDPYIEALGAWQDFHNRLIGRMVDALDESLPAAYAARNDERVTLARHFEADAPSVIRPDVLVGRRPGAEEAVAVAGGAVATLEPVELTIAGADLEEIRDWFIEVVRLPELEVVTVVEVLSPTNKGGPGRRDYLAKRDDLLGRGVNLVEVDLLLGGRRLPMAEPLPPGDYYAIVARAERRPRADVYAWSIRRPLPPIPIPLRAPDPDVVVDLGALASAVHDRARYPALLRYDRPLGLPLSTGDLDWAEAIARAMPRAR